MTISTAQIRSTFVDFFAARAHEVVPSASLIPVDRTLLLTAAGMVPFKPFMVGEETAPWPRAVTVQKCARAGGKHNDLDQVGRTARHLTFFEMLGNFSFGDYFKELAIPYAWELVTEGLGVDPELLWVTVHDTDDEAAAIWEDVVGVAPGRIQRMGEDNWWSMGVAGPCGPSSEIFFDKGAAFGADGGPAVDDDRYVELWNLVFMQFLRDDDGTVLGDLPQRNIDTGAGLERISATLNGFSSVYDIDTIRPVMAVGESMSGVAYGADERSDVSLRILGDHGRCVTMLVTDGVFPSNEERGYVLRRIVRRAVRHAWLLGISEPVTPRLAAVVADVLGDAYPEVRRGLDTTQEILENEEGRFRATLARGLADLSGALDALPDGADVPGVVAFTLHDTFGFPVELTAEIAAESGRGVDMDGFDAEMARQQAMGRAAAGRDGDDAAAGSLRAIAAGLERTGFLGYETTVADATVTALVVVDGATPEQVDAAGAGASVAVFTDRTPFYAESGGQVGDTGVLTTDGGARVEVLDTQYGAPGVVRHDCRVLDGELRVGDSVHLVVDDVRRDGLRRHHTATHLLHWALRTRLGDHVRQHGSIVLPDRLRFDFSHFAPLADDEVAEIEALANGEVFTNGEVRNYETTKTEADARGVLAFFGDKYGERVRVLEAGGNSKELCGGTHVHALGEIGPIVITNEESIGSNLRRIEAVVGPEALAYLQRQRSALRSAAQTLRAKPEEVPEALDRRLEELSAVRREADALAAKLAAGAAGQLVDEAFDLGGGARGVVARVDGLGGPKDLQRLAADLRGRLASGVVLLGASFDGKASLVCAVSKDLQAAGVSAADVVRPAAELVGGGTGRNADTAMAGGPLGDALDAALDAGRAVLEERAAATAGSGASS